MPSCQLAVARHGEHLAYLTNGIDADLMRDGFRSYIVSTLASQLV